MPVVARIANDSRDYTVDEIPNGVSGQVYVVLSASGVDFADDHTIAGPAVLEASFSRTPHGTFLSLGCAGLMPFSGVPDWSGAVDASCGMSGGVGALRDPVSGCWRRWRRIGRGLHCVPELFFHAFDHDRRVHSHCGESQMRLVRK